MSSAFTGLAAPSVRPERFAIRILTWKRSALARLLHPAGRYVTLPDISNNVGPVKYFCEQTSPLRRPRLVGNLSIGFSPTQTSFDQDFDQDY